MTGWDCCCYLGTSVPTVLYGAAPRSTARHVMTRYNEFRVLVVVIILFGTVLHSEFLLGYLLYWTIGVRVTVHQCKGIAVANYYVLGHKAQRLTTPQLSTQLFLGATTS